MSPREESDEWVFDTVKQATVAHKKNTTKRRKLSVIHANGQGLGAAEEALKRLDLKDAPLEYSSPPHLPASISQGTVRRTPSVVPPDSPLRGRQASVQRRPLQPDMSFGNQGSTVRLFRRVSDNSTTAQVSGDESSCDSILKEEKRPPTVETTTKEAILGRRAFNKVVDPAFQELYAQTGNQSKQEALSRVANAWSILDAVDPEGQYQLLKLLIDKAHKDPKLASLLPAAKQQPASPQASPQKSPAKLVLAQNNPHLKSHRRRQSSMLEMREKLPKLPGEAVPGMEHTKQLADVLYGRWADGLRNRWGAAS